MKEVTKQSGFTLIEMVVVILVIVILAVMALPRILNFQKDARIAVLESALASMKAINNQVNLMSHLDYVVVRLGESPDSRLQFIDLNRDGIQQEDQGEWSLIWQYLDNTHMSAAISVNGDVTDMVTGRENYYLGFERGNAINLVEGNCWVLYHQPGGAGEVPEYQLESTGC